VLVKIKNSASRASTCLCYSEKRANAYDTSDPQRVPPHDLARPPDARETTHGNTLRGFDDQFLVRMHGMSTTAPPVLGLKSRRFLARRVTSLELHQKHGHEFLQRGNIPVSRANARSGRLKQSGHFQRVNFDIRSLCLRGRSAINPRTAPLCGALLECSRKEIAKNVSSVTAGPMSRGKPEQQGRRSGLCKGCPYLCARGHQKSHTSCLWAHSII